MRRIGGYRRCVALARGLRRMPWGSPGGITMPSRLATTTCPIWCRGLLPENPAATTSGCWSSSSPIGATAAGCSAPQGFAHQRAQIRPQSRPAGHRIELANGSPARVACEPALWGLPPPPSSQTPQAPPPASRGRAQNRRRCPAIRPLFLRPPSPGGWGRWAGAALSAGSEGAANPIAQARRSPRSRLCVRSGSRGRCRCRPRPPWPRPHPTPR